LIDMIASLRQSFIIIIIIIIITTTHQGL